MDEPIFSPDGNFMWTGSEWIPAPPNAPESATNLSPETPKDSLEDHAVILNETHPPPESTRETSLDASQPPKPWITMAITIPMIIAAIIVASQNSSLGSGCAAATSLFLIAAGSIERKLKSHSYTPKLEHTSKSDRNVVTGNAVSTNEPPSTTLKNTFEWKTWMSCIAVSGVLFVASFIVYEIAWQKADLMDDHRNADCYIGDAYNGTYDQECESNHDRIADDLWEEYQNLQNVSFALAFFGIVLVVVGIKFKIKPNEESIEHQGGGTQPEPTVVIPTGRPPTN